jgi:hypothetical protein
MKKSALLLLKIIGIILTASFLGNAGTILKQFGSFKTVNAILADGNLLWLATSGGIISFDRTSKAVKTYTDISDIPDLLVTAATQDASGNLWFGTNNGYLIKFDPPTETFTTYNALVATEWNIKCMRLFANHLLIGTNNGLSIYSIARNNFENVKKFGTFTNPEVSAIHIYGDTIAIVTAGGIAFTVVRNVSTTIFSDPKIWKLIPAKEALGIIRKPDTLLSSGQNVLQIGLDSIFEFGGPNSFLGPRIIFRNSVFGEFPSQITCAVQLDHDLFAVGTTKSSCYLFSPSNNQYDQIWINGPEDSNIKGCVVDQNGILWFVPYDMTNGVGTFDGTTWNSITRGLGRLETGPDVCKNTVTVTTTNDIWVSTLPNGLKWFNRSTGNWSHYEDPKTIPPPDDPTYTTEPSPLVRYMTDTTLWWTFISGTCEDSLGNIWVANNKAYTGDVLHVRKPRDNSSWRSFNMNNSLLGLLSDYTGPIAANQNKGLKKQYIYLGYTRKEDMSGGGLTILSYSSLSDPISSTTNVVGAHYRPYISVTGFAVINDTLVWVSTEDGIYKVTNNDPGSMKKIEKITSSDVFQTIAVGLDGQPVFCKDKDIYSYNDADSTLTNISKSSAIGTPVNGIAADRKNGVYWIASNKGLYRLLAGGGSIGADAPGKGSVTVYPNPISLSYLRKTGRSVHFSNLDAQATLIVRIYDVTGTSVRVLLEKNPLKTGIINWNGTNNSGRLVVPGAYFYHTTAANGKLARGKIFVIP